MRNYTHRLSYALLFQSLLLLGCQKDIKETSINGETQSDDSRWHGDGNIRLVNVNSEFGPEDYEYNKKGLLSNWILFGGSTEYIHDYDRWGRLKTSLWYFEGVLQSTIKFFYNNKGQRYHEIWYVGDTDEIWDEVFYTFDHKGNGIKLVSPVQNYYTLNTYTNEGNLNSWVFYFNNIIVAGSTYTYSHHLKNPFSAIPGLVFGYPFTSGFFYANKHYSTSESFTFYDENGNVLEEFPQDPSKTVVTAGPQNYVATSDFWQINEAAYVHFVFTYEKGKQGYYSWGESKDKRRLAFERLMRRDSKKTMKEKVQEFRRDSRN